MERINDGIRELWKSGFFEAKRTISEVKDKLRTDFGFNPTNVTMNLKSCGKILRREASLWVQTRRYSVINEQENEKLEKLFATTTDKGLFNACKDNYVAKNYWDMVFNALRHMEIRVRSKSGLPAAEVGADLMEKAFKPQVGALKVPSCATLGEEDGFRSITKGMMMFHRNAKGHREETIDEEAALKILGYIDYLIKTVENCEKRTQASS